MSIKALSWAWQTSAKANQKLVLLALADHANDDGECWPGLKGIAKKCGVTERAIIKYINELIKNKIIFKRAQFDGSGRQKTNVYTLNMSSLGMNNIHPGVNNIHGESEQCSGGRVNNVHPNHHIEPSLETNTCKVLQTSPSSASKVKPSKEQKLPAEALGIFQHWQQVMNHPKAKLDDKRKRKIMQALKNYSADELKQAIDGCAKSPYHMGQNENGQHYDDIELILRDAKHIEQFISTSLATPQRNHASNKFAQPSNVWAGVI